MSGLGEPSHWHDWSLPRLAACKEVTRTTVSVVIPARNEEPTVGDVVTGIAQLAQDTGLVDELVVMDSDSTDKTAETAETAARAGG